MLPNDPKQRETIVNYLQEAIKYTKERKLADIRIKSVFSSVKDCEDNIGISLSEFKLLLNAVLKEAKFQEDVENKSEALAAVAILTGKAEAEPDEEEEAEDE